MKKNLLLLTLFLFIFGCKQTDVSKKADLVVPESYTQQEIDDLNYVLSLSDHHENFIYDHSDERQHRHFLAHLKRQGYTEESNPALFRSIKDLRTHHQKLRAQGMLRTDASLKNTTNGKGSPIAMVTGTGVLKVTAGTGEVVPVQTVSALGMIDASHATSTALSSIAQTAYYSQNSIQLLNGAGPLGDPVTSEQYYGGADLKAVTSEPYTSAPGDVLAAKMTYYYKLDSNSIPITGQFIASCKDCLASGACPSFNNIEPIGPTGQTSPIIVCVYRKSAGECTYWSDGGGNSHNIVFPVKGSVTFAGKSIQVQTGTNKVEGGTAQMLITNSESGGGCNMTSSANFFNDPNTVVSGASNSTLSWDFDPASFGNACFSSGESVNFVQTMKIPATDGTQMCAYVSNSTLADTAVYVTYEIGPMNVYYGCLAEGSMVMMADGSTKPIEEVVVGEGVKSADRNWTVTQTTMGTEPIPSVKITTENGEELILTEDHPVVTASGVEVAKALKPGTTIYTLVGTTKIASKEMVQYNGKVWNLRLGDNDSERALLTEDNSTFYTNGILVGDSRMQKIHMDYHRNNKVHVLQHLPLEWHQDYLNSLKR